jgi:hypothetical protein
VLDHIFQSYIDQDGNHQRLSAQVYYTTFLNAVRSFYDLEEYPIDIAGIFMDHIDPRLAKGFRINYPDFGKARSRNALDQRTLLTDMLGALIKSETSVTNILEVIGDARGGEQFLSNPPPGGSAPAFPSVAETTLNRYSRRDDSTKGSDTTGSFIERKCFGCGQPHPWAKKEQGKFVVCCPNANKPGIREHAAAQIKDFQARRGRKNSKGTKRKNLNTVNWDDIPSARREVLLQQHRAGSTVTLDGGGSVASSITGATTTRASGNRNGSLTLHQDVVVLSSNSSKPPIPIAIHSPMAHISLQTGTSVEEKDCPNLRCVVDTGAALSTANFHYMEAIIRQYPHILKRVYLPADYAAIVLSGIVTSSDDSPITTELPVGFEIHLNYLTKDGSDTSLLVAAGPDVAVNLILGLPFIKATGLICDFVDNVCQAKHLLCDPFPIDFKRASKSIPVFSVTGAPCNVNNPSDTIRILDSLRTIFPCNSGKEKGPIHPSRSKIRFGDRWVPPVSSDSSASSGANDYHHQVLGDLGYL